MYTDAARYHTTILISETRWNVYRETLRAIYVTKCVRYTFAPTIYVYIKVRERERERDDLNVV